MILFHENTLNDKEKKEYIEKSDSIKICLTENKNNKNNWDAELRLPLSIKEINTIVENIAAKKTFSKNSSIKVKKYLLDKNEKRLFKNNQSVILTEKEIKLIELFLSNSKPIQKDYILSTVWNYSADADTHTVETHVYRLRKKISEKFMDDNFILNNKDGYYL